MSCVFNIYVNARNDLLVVAAGRPIPAELGASWRKKRAVRVVSASIRQDVLQAGYHGRRLSGVSTKKCPESAGAKVREPRSLPSDAFNDPRAPRFGLAFNEEWDTP